MQICSAVALSGEIWGLSLVRQDRRFGPFRRVGQGVHFDFGGEFFYARPVQTRVERADCRQGAGAGLRLVDRLGERPNRAPTVLLIQSNTLLSFEYVSSFGRRLRNWRTFPLYHGLGSLGCYLLQPGDSA